MKRISEREFTLIEVLIELENSITPRLFYGMGVNDMDVIKRDRGMTYISLENNCHLPIDRFIEVEYED